MRVYEIAKELGISSKEILSALEKKNIVLASHMSHISDEILNTIRELFGKKKTEIKPTVA